MKSRLETSMTTSVATGRALERKTMMNGTKVGVGVAVSGVAAEKAIVVIVVIASAVVK